MSENLFHSCSFYEKIKGKHTMTERRERELGLRWTRVPIITSGHWLLRPWQTACPHLKCKDESRGVQGCSLKADVRQGTLVPGTKLEVP